MALLLHGGVFACYSSLFSSPKPKAPKEKPPTLQVSLQAGKDSLSGTENTPLLEENNSQTSSNENSEPLSSLDSPHWDSTSEEELQEALESLPLASSRWKLKELPPLPETPVEASPSQWGSLPDFSLKTPAKASSSASSSGKKGASPAPGSGKAASQGASRNPGNSGNASSSSGLIAGATHPRYKHNPLPPYPHQARQLGKEGVVLLQIIVSAEGLPESVTLLSSSGEGDLDSAALSHVKRTWRFHPGTYNNNPVRTSVQVPIHFTLK